MSIINKMASWIAYAAIVGMMFFVFYDVIARYLGYPTSGSNDVVQVLSVIVVAFAMGYTLVLKRHPATLFLVERLSRRIQEYIAVITTLVSLVTFILLAWASSSLASRILATHEGTMTLGIPIYPLAYCITLGSVLMCLVFIMHFLEALRKVVKG